MAKVNAAITAVGGYVPDYILTNKELESMVDTTDEWITSRTGIKERRILKDESKATSDMGAKAAEEVLRKRGIDASEIDLVIVGTVTGDYVFPDTANQVALKIGATNAFGFDINAACSGFIYTLFTAAKFIETGTYKKVLVVGADQMSSIIDYQDRTTCIIFGDGAGAVLLEPSEEYGIIDSVMKADGSGADYLRLAAGGSKMPASAETVANRLHYVYQDGRPVFKAAVKGMSTTIMEVLERNNLSKEEISYVVPHQANMRIIKAVADQLDYPYEKVLVNIEKLGNTTAATIPLCLNDFESQLKKGDKIILTAFGGGFTWGSVLLTWAYN